MTFPSSIRRPIRALLLEDSALDSELARVKLETAFPDCEVVEVDRRESFETHVRAGGFDVVISDIDLPDYSGEEAMCFVRTASPATPFVFLSGATPEERVADLLRGGADDFVSKNRIERLPLAIKRAISEARARADLEDERRGRQRANAFVEGVLESLRGHAVVAMDADGDIVEWSRAATLMFGYAREEAIGMHASSLYEDGSRAAFDHDAEAARRHGTSVDARSLRRADGTAFLSDGVMTSLRDARGEVSGYIKLARDMTASHEAAAALRAAKEEAERANRAKDRFLAVLSHELRAPLAPISTAAAALRTATLDHARQEKLTRMIERNVALQARLIDDLFDLSAISSGKLPLSRENVDVRALAESCMEMVRAVAEERGVKLIIDWRARRCQVDGDPARLQQILWNLLRNAVKFSHLGGSVVLRAADLAAGLRIEVEDFGIGIPEAALGAIFDPFAQADENVARRYGGLGLGLSIAKSLAEMHGGILGARSGGAGLGATFSLELPASEVCEAELETAITADDLKLDMLSILLVEDDPDAGDAMAMALEIHGARVQVARSLTAAREALAGSSRFSAVVADLGLPDGSGLDVPTMATEPVPMLALSGFGGPEAESRSREAGFRAHLVKPANADKVIAALRAALSTNKKP